MKIDLLSVCLKIESFRHIDRKRYIYWKSENISKIKENGRLNNRRNNKH